MERVGILINKLKEQFDQHVATEKLMDTAMLIMVELKERKKMLSIGRVETTMSSVNMNIGLPTLNQSESPLIKDPIKKKEASSGMLFDLSKEFTKAETGNGKEVFELNDIITEDTPVINDHLKKIESEVAHGFKETPIRDLKNAIGINDRYVFINELFRGDETMYERSLKTINEFPLFLEAQYWIQRELKVKLGWNEKSETVLQFDQLVKRRFASI